MLPGRVLAICMAYSSKKFPGSDLPDKADPAQPSHNCR